MSDNISEYRGYNSYLKKWFYGTLVESDGLSYIYAGNDVYLINPKTLCQYTGMKDRVGKPVYDKDLVYIEEYQDIFRVGRKDNKWIFLDTYRGDTLFLHCLQGLYTLTKVTYEPSLIKYIKIYNKKNGGF